jgi:hypothetical protein
MGGYSSIPARGKQKRPRHHCLLRSGQAAATALLMLAQLSGMQSGAQSHKPSQYEVEAVYLYDFGKFVRWPEEANASPLQICVAGQDPYGDALRKTIAGENINGRELSVRHVSRTEEAGCSILFIDTSESAHLAPLLAGVSGKPVLTVSEIPNFLERGGMIQFEVVSNRVRFSVNLTAANRSHLSVSSELLKVALNVIGQPDAGGMQ